MSDSRLGYSETILCVCGLPAGVFGGGSAAVCRPQEQRADDEPSPAAEAADGGAAGPAGHLLGAADAGQQDGKGGQVHQISRLGVLPPPPPLLHIILSLRKANARFCHCAIVHTI
eukprot:scaffold429252_cov19-Prasinocladus_malaysianus.AAC.1